jgi:hypothetical protein
MASPGPAFGVPYGFDSDYEAALYGELEVCLKQSFKIAYKGYFLGRGSDYNASI